MPGPIGKNFSKPPSSGGGGGPFTPAVNKAALPATAATTVNLTVGANTPGNLIVVYFANVAPSGTTLVSLVGITDNVGNTYIPIETPSSGANDAILAYCANPLGGVTTITGTANLAGTILVIAAAEFPMQGAVLDQHTSNTGTSTSADSGNTGATTRASELIVGAIALFSSTVGGPGIVATSPAAVIGFTGTGFGIELSAGTLSSTGVQHAAFTLTGSLLSWLDSVATFYSSSGGGFSPGTIQRGFN